MAPDTPDLFGSLRPAEDVPGDLPEHSPDHDDIQARESRGNDPAQQALFDMPKDWERHWKDMPEFKQQSLVPFDNVNVQFRNEADRRAFMVMMGHSPARLRSIWFPPMEQLRQSTAPPEAAHVRPGRYPVYIVSKGRAESRLTAKALDLLGLPYFMVIEPQEFEQYAAVQTALATILCLPFSDQGSSIPARNWIWDHAAQSGATRHWILDDNIDGFYRLNRNRKTRVRDHNPFTACEDFSDRYENVGLSGLNYEFFADRRAVHPPFLLNTRIYSCILIDNNLPFRWRGRYNEDTDLSLRVLKSGQCTVLFNAWLAKKLPTMTMGGGNTEELYQGDGRRLMAESLREQHPDVVRITQRWGRWQHVVDYKPFQRNRLILRSQGETA